MPGGGVVLLTHGVWENRLEMVHRAEVLHRAGFGVLLFDLQGHGESQGRHITFGALEGRGVAAAAAFVRRRAPGERLGADGVSLGGAAAILAPGLRLNALVLESVYPTIDAALVNRLRENLPRPVAFVAPMLAPVFKLLMPPIIGVAAGDLRPIDHIADVSAPLLVLAGSLDTRTPVPEARALYAAAHEPKQLHIVEGAGHVDLEKFNPDGYWRIVLPFLQRTLQ